MNVDRWSRVESVFERALDLDPQDRPPFLLSACADAEGVVDESLLEEVRSLLAAEEGAGGFLGGVKAEGGPGRAARRVLDAAGQALDVPPDRIGPYRVLGLLGRGGMGAVYRAERADGAFEQTVALKVVHQGLSASARRRFLAERQILARLDHPSIARLLDGGLLPDGRPYFAMEWVQGEPITDYCVGRALPLAERLQLFAEVADAVQHAHRNLVVHRDIKPSNVLVVPGEAGGRPRVKLLDFGIAKLLDPGLLPQTLVLTQEGTLLLTPEYAAPEQVLGQPVTTATDVYQLGVVLFEILTGRKPYRVPTGGTRRAVEEAVIHGQPLRPSTAALQPDAHPAPRTGEAEGTRSDGEASTAPHGHAARVQEPSARWAKRLAGDLDRICLKALRKEPERRYESAGGFASDIRRFLSGKPVTAQRDTFGYRFRTLVRRRPAAAIAGGAFLLLLIGYAITVTLQAREIAREREVAQAEADKAEQVTAFVTGLFSAADPNEQALYGPLNSPDVSARQLVDRGAQRADALSAQPDVQAHLYDVIAQTYLGIGEVPEALAAAERALALRRGLHGRPHATVAQAWATLGAAQYAAGETEAAHAAYTRALAIGRQVQGVPPVRLATYHNLIAIAEATLARHESAADHYAEALAVYRSEAPENVALVLHNLGSLHHHMGRYEQAEAYFTESMALRRDVLNSAELESDRRQAQVGLAQSLALLGPVLRDRGRLEEAASMLREAATLYGALFPENHGRLQETQLNYASVLVVQGQMAEAARLLEPVVETRRERFGAEHWRTASAEAWLGGAYTGLGRFAEAEPLLLRAHGVVRALRGSGDRYVLEIRAGLARLYAAWGRQEEAARYASGLPPELLQLPSAAPPGS